MRLIDADALIEYLKEIWGRWDEDDWYEAEAKDAMKEDIAVVNEQPTIDAISMREWNLLRNSIQELQENNTEKKDVQFVTKFLLRLMDISKRRDKNEV